MNWDALAAIGELLGAAGVIATLAYRSVQVRQNTKATRGVTLNLLTQHPHSELRWGAEIGWSLRKAITAPDRMSEEDEWQVSEYLVSHFVTRQDEFVQYREGLLKAEDW